MMSSLLVLVSNFSGCDSDSDSGIQVRNFANTGCKPAEARSEGRLQDRFGPEYIEYKGMEDGYLSLKHVNAMFECYTEELRMEATVSGNEISIIEEARKNSDDDIGAACQCPYDLYCEVGPLTASQYTIVVYRKSYQLFKKAHFTISYSKGLDGKFSISEP